MAHRRERFSHPQAGKPKPRRRGPIGDGPDPSSQEIAKSLGRARARQDSVEKVIEISAVALDMSRTGNVALAYNTFGEAVRAAKSLPLHLREDALSHVMAAFRETGMHIDCYFGLLRTYGPHLQAHLR